MPEKRAAHEAAAEERQLTGRLFGTARTQDIRTAENDLSLVDDSQVRVRRAAEVTRSFSRSTPAPAQRAKRILVTML